MFDYDYIYHKRDGIQERRGTRCRVICRGRGPGPRNKLIEFADGFRCVTTFYGVRKAPLVLFLATWIVCRCSWYSPKPAHESMYGSKLLTAHRTLRPGTKLEVENVETGKRVVVTVAGFGPARYTRRDLDLSRAAFSRISLPSRGVARVRYRVIDSRGKR